MFCHSLESHLCPRKIVQFPQLHVFGLLGGVLHICVIGSCPTDVAVAVQLWSVLHRNTFIILAICAD